MVVSIVLILIYYKKIIRISESTYIYIIVHRIFCLALLKYKLLAIHLK